MKQLPLCPRGVQRRPLASPHSSAAHQTLSLRYAAPGPTASTYWGRTHSGDAHTGLSPTCRYSSPVARRAEHYAIQTPERTNHRKFPSPFFSQTRRDRRVGWPAVRTVRTPSATSATRREKEAKVKRKERKRGREEQPAGREGERVALVGDYRSRSHDPGSQQSPPVAPSFPVPRSCSNTETPQTT